MEILNSNSAELLLFLFHLSVISVSALTTSPPASCLKRPYLNTWEKDYFPNPQQDINEDYCSRGCKQSWVCDPGHVLTIEQADALDRKINEIRTFGVCGCSSCDTHNGYSVSVAIVPNLMVISGQTLVQTANEFAYYLKNKRWNFGICQNDVVILLSKENKLVQIAIGNVTKDIINDECLNKTKGKADTLVAGGNIYGALDHLVTRFGQILKQRICDLQQTTSSAMTIALIAILSTLGCLLVVLVVYVFLHQQGKCRREQRYGINAPPITITIHKPHKKKNKHTHHSDDESSPVKLSDENKTDEVNEELKLTT